MMMNALFHWLEQRFAARWADLFAVRRIALTVSPHVLERARVLVADYEPMSESGEWKRHQIYAKLLKEFPYEKKAYISLMIEAAKCGL
jgi:hypothetical protein